MASDQDLLAYILTWGRLRPKENIRHGIGIHGLGLHAIYMYISYLFYEIPYSLDRSCVEMFAEYF